MIRFFKPTKHKLLTMVLIWASIWCADKLSDILDDPLLRKATPELWHSVKQATEPFEEPKEDAKADYIKVAIILTGVQFCSRALVSYFFACVVLALAERNKSQNQRVELTR